MFGLKWLWKTNRGSNIDTSNFVSKEFLNTTLQDYVNRDLLNTTLSNELANYVSTTSLNNTLSNYVLNSALNTTLSSYVQTNTLSNYVSTNTNQTITGAKTFSNQVVINNTPEPLVLKATNTNKSYILFKTPQNTSTLSIGSNATGANIDINSGDLTIETQQTNKTITLNTGRVKFNRSAIEFGTDINAGYGGATVKFIPEDNSTKTLQFFNNNANDTRRFKLAVPEPVDNNNPATKQYVDNAIANIPSSPNQSINYQDITISSYGSGPGIWGDYATYTIEITYTTSIFLAATVHYPSDTWGRAVEFSYNFGSSPKKIFFNFRINRNDNQGLPPTNTTFIRIFYIGDTRTTNPFRLVEGDN